MIDFVAKDITNKIKLSPMNKSRGKNTEHSQKMRQFDRSAFKSSGEKAFDEIYEFDRGLTESFRYANTQKYGSLEQRMTLYKEKQKIEQAQKLRPAMKLEQATSKNNEVKQQYKPAKVNLL